MNLGCWRNVSMFLGLTLSVGILFTHVVWGAPADPALSLTDKDKGKTFTLKVGETLTLEVRHPSGTGYKVLPPVFEARVLKFLRHREDPPVQAGHPRVGFPIRHLYEFQTVGVGRTDLMVQIARPWEKDKPPLEIFRATIIGQL